MNLRVCILVSSSCNVVLEAVMIITWKITSYLLIFVVIRNVSSFKHVCVIGAGPAGLISTRFLASNLNEFKPIVFEKNSNVGGLWIYTDSTTVDEHGLPVHSSMYKYLRINGPKELLKYPDFVDIGGGNTSFVRHEVILEYLRKYADHFNLRQYIQFDTNVEKVIRASKKKWLVKTRHLNSNKTKSINCDAVIIANGHFVKGNIPTIPGIEGFAGRVIHSHLYRYPEQFAGQTVAVLGASFSGIDIAVEISSHAKKVYLSSKISMSRVKFPSNLEQVDPVVEATNNSHLVLSDGIMIKADALVLCTGYLYDFPFLDSSSGIVVDSGKYVKPLYKHLINAKHPTMAILNLPHPGFPLLMPYAQVQYFLAVLRGKVKLSGYFDPELPEDASKSKAHFMESDRMMSYYNELAIAAGGEPLPPYFRPAIHAYWSTVLDDPVYFRNKNLKIRADNSVIFA